MDEIAPLSLWLHFVKPTELHYPATLLQFLILLQFFHIHSVGVKNGVKGGGKEFFLTRKLNNKHTVIIILIKLCSMLGAGWLCPSDFPSIIVLGICGSIPADEGDLSVSGAIPAEFQQLTSGVSSLSLTASAQAESKGLLHFSGACLSLLISTNA